jgi:adenylate kinase family enzyme
MSPLHKLEFAMVMQTCRIHITGASGAGVTTLGRALADTLVAAHHDTDDYYWLPSTPPYQTKRAIPDRVRLIREIFLDRSDWVLSGALESWGAPLVPYFDLVAFIATPTPVRLQRLAAREARHFGIDAVKPGGWRHEECAAFLEWASHYDDGTAEGRSLQRHETWLATLPCPVLRLDGTLPVATLVATACAALGR